MSKKIIRIVVGLIWLLIAFVYYRKGNNITTIGCAILGLVFVFMGFKSNNETKNN